MSNPSDLLGDRPLEQFSLLSADTPAELALARQAGDWLVVVDETKKPIGAVTRKAVSQLDKNAPVRHALAGSPTVVADARTPVGLLLNSPAIRSSYPGAVIVQKGTKVAGIWAEDELLEQALASTRFTSDWALPGDISIPLVLRGCRFKDGGKSCAFVKGFKEKPVDPFACPNPERLKDHDFSW